MDTGINDTLLCISIRVVIRNVNSLINYNDFYTVEYQQQEFH